jgi:hypothetical protein
MKFYAQLFTKKMFYQSLIVIIFASLLSSCASTKPEPFEHRSPASIDDAELQSRIIMTLKNGDADGKWGECGNSPRQYANTQSTSVRCEHWTKNRIICHLTVNTKNSVDTSYMLTAELSFKNDNTLKLDILNCGFIND